MTLVERPVLANANAEVVNLLKYWLSEAEKGDLHHIALAVTKTGDQVAYDYAGAFGLEDRTVGAMRTAISDLETLILSRRPEAKNFDLGASYVEYHLTGTPICWDFLIWLIDAEMTRRRLGGPAPLRIHFSREELLNAPSRKFFENVYRPLLPLIGAVEDADAKGGRHKPLYTPMDIVLASRAGEEVPKLNATPNARYTMKSWLHGTEPIVITLREAEHWKHRNSNLDAWLRFAKDLQDKNYDVIFLRDTEKAIEPLVGFATCPIASFNVDLRMALYEKARINLFVSNGPAGLALFGDRPYLYFLHIRHDPDYPANNPGWWYCSNGVAEGSQWPWAKPDQRMIWKPDTYENISTAWEEFVG